MLTTKYSHQINSLRLGQRKGDEWRQSVTRNANTQSGSSTDKTH